MPKHIYPLKLCPWCKKTPKFYMLMGTKESTEGTYCPYIKCENHECMVMPKTKHVPIRKGQRFDKEVLKIKLDKLIGFWNNDNPMPANEGIELDIEDIANNGGLK